MTHVTHSFLDQSYYDKNLIGLDFSYLTLQYSEAVVQMCSVKMFPKYENTCDRVSFLIKRLWQRCFLVNFAKFLRIPFCIKLLRWLLLNVSWRPSKHFWGIGKWMEKFRFSFEKVGHLFSESLLNPLQPSVSYLYPLKTSENLKVLWSFQGV